MNSKKLSSLPRVPVLLLGINKWRGVVRGSVGLQATLIFGFLFSISSAAEILNISGQEVDVHDVTYRKNGLGHNIPHSAKLSSPTELPFARGNKILFSGEVFFHDNGGVWMASPLESTHVSSWVTPSGQVVNLNCGQPPNVNGLPVTTRFVTFYQSGEYSSGCRYAGNGALKTAKGDVLIPNAATAIDLDEKGHLKYASSIKSGSIHHSGQMVALLSGKEVEFYENGEPTYFYMSPEARLTLNFKKFGRVELAQRSKNPTFIQLNAQGQLEHGVLGQDLKVKDLILKVGTILVFERPDVLVDGELDLRDWAAVLPEPMNYALVSGPVLFSRLLFGKSEDVIGGVNSEGFVFRAPEGFDVHVSPGARIYLEKRTIVRIDLPGSGS